MYSPTSRIVKSIEKQLVKNGTMARIDARKQKHEEVAKVLGFASAQQAFNAMGKAFLTIANK